MFENIKAKLKNNGYIPDTIIDIGACYGEFTDSMIDIYPNAKYYLFEANNNPDLQKYLIRSNVEVFNATLYSKEDIVDWYEIKNEGDSLFKELSKDYVNVLPIKKYTNVLRNMINCSGMKNVFIKIACQGSEISILEGAGNILKVTDFILLQTPFFGKYNDNSQSFLEYIRFMDDLGFIPYDIRNCDNVNGFLMKCYVLFINKNHPFNQDVQIQLINKHINVRDERGKLL
jgi:FkbM family methyltransferase